MSVEVRFPDGTVIRASAYSDRHTNDRWRDFGLYCDPLWNPSWPSETIEWEDFGLPADFQAAADAIKRAFEMAQAGRHVEVGCLGGRGRTGTVLGCMAILAGVPAPGAVDWVRWNYHPEAIETPQQEQWVREFPTIDS